MILTGTSYLVDLHSSQKSQEQLWLKFVRQVVEQAKSLVLSGTEMKKPHPLTWAIEQLNPAVKGARLFHVYEVQVSYLDVDQESYRFDPKKAEMDYVRVLFPQDHRGVRVVVQIHPLGFLGSESAFLGDFLIVLLFALYFGMLWFAYHWVVVKTAPSSSLGTHQEPVSTFPSSEAVNAVEEVKALKHEALQLAVQIRNLLLSIKKLFTYSETLRMSLSEDQKVAFDRLQDEFKNESHTTLVLLNEQVRHLKQDAASKKPSTSESRFQVR